MSGLKNLNLVLVWSSLLCMGCRLSFFREKPPEKALATDWESALFSPSSQDDVTASGGKDSLYLKYSPVSFEKVTHNFVTYQFQREYTDFEACQVKPKRNCLSDVSFESLIYLPPFSEGEVSVKARACEEIMVAGARKSDCGPWASITFVQNQLDPAFRAWHQEVYLTKIQARGVAMTLLNLLEDFRAREIRDFDHSDSPEKVRILKKMIGVLTHENHELALLSLVSAGSALPWEILRLTTAIPPGVRASLGKQQNIRNFQRVTVIRPDLHKNLDVLCEGLALLNYCMVLNLEKSHPDTKQLAFLRKSFRFAPAGNKDSQTMKPPGSGSRSFAWHHYHRAAGVHGYKTVRAPSGNDESTCMDLPWQVCRDPLALWSLTPDQQGSLRALNRHIIYSRAILNLFAQLRKERSVQLWTDQIEELDKKIQDLLKKAATLKMSSQNPGKANITPNYFSELKKTINDNRELRQIF